mmetsp:Transcript_53892/g.118170  ORF Transcript_53892/g.118170 Transcript_53892/m.118170 type:complete len:997 (+) Transcript_53892:64-3054(+)|eukprot:CAMPEP_0204270456 /NCGR_PEP_ID=MMETSP0468-20130131/18903_1 /ASSEMBLY_ACC=CAM_ASM_000383 /TAXON_ID=2969 /ORGANISM="Oxyrrhis marina" /LENGTH=996 /DNA_ID=CAMNT_0051245997 /DNA_START=59 /DNA_END=3049 /DNA_ORIENTATION=-
MQLAVVLFGAAAAAQPLALMSQQVNRSNSWSEVSEAHAAVRRALVGWSWQHERPHFDAAMDRVPLETMLKHVGDQIPQRVLAALRKHKGDGPESLSEDELNHARGVINGMMEGQVTQLDISVVECKELKDKNTMTENVVVADLSRLGTKLANEKKRIIESQGGIEEAQGNIKDSEDSLRDHEGKCTTETNTLEAQLSVIKQDLDAAALIVKLTECKKPTFLQGRVHSTVTPVKACGPRQHMVVTAGAKDVTFKQASAAAAFQKALAASVSAPVVSAAAHILPARNHTSALMQEPTEDGWFKVEGVYSGGHARKADDSGEDSTKYKLDDAKIACRTSPNCQAVTCLKEDCTVRASVELLESSSGEITYVQDAATGDPVAGFTGVLGTCSGCSAEEVDAMDPIQGTHAACGIACSDNALCKSFSFIPPMGSGNARCRFHTVKCVDDDKKCRQLPIGPRIITYNKDDVALGPGSEQTVPEIGPSRVDPPAAQQAFKCTVAEPDCGLLNDNMALFWGEVKDRYDAKMSELVATRTACAQTSTTINEETALWNALLQERNTELGEATSEQSEATQSQIDKQREQRELQSEFQMIDTKCTHTVGEIMTNLCGLRKVRSELATFSKGSMTPDLIQDCVTTDWSPQECSAECEGGRQILVRTVSQETSLGIKCPPLQMVKKCNEIPCPINCKMAEWSKWGRCSKECGGGLQARVRNIETRPDFGGEACPAQGETQQCNPDSCDEDCKLSEWSNWKPCTKACGGGSQRRTKHVEVGAKGAGRCANHLNSARYERQACNAGPCPPDPICTAKLDIVLVVDSSGSWTQKGYDVVKTFVEGLVDRYDFGAHSVKMGLVEFSKDAHIIQGMTFDKAAFVKAVTEKLMFRKGLTDMAKGLLSAEKVLLDGRKDSQSQVIVVTDGKPSFKFATHNAAKKLTRGGVRLVFMPVRTYGESPFLLDWASHPGAENVFRVKKGLAELEEKQVEWQKKLLVSTCAQIRSPLLENLR